MLNLGVFHLFYNQVRRRRVHIFVGASILCIYVFTQKPSWETIVSEHEMKLIPTSLSSKFSLIPRETTGKSMEEAFYNKENIPVNASHKNMAAAEIQATNLHRRQIVEAFEKSAITSVKNGTLHSQNSSQESSKNEGDSLKGFLNHHIWEYVCNHQVASLRGFILYPKLPSKRRFLFSSSSKQGRNVNNFGERVFGFLVPPSSGEYQFSISSSGDSELWLSSDEKLENLQKIAYLAWQGRPGRSKQGNFSNFQSQISSSIFLHAEVSYCIDIIHKHQSGKTRLDVVWRPPNSTQYTTIKSEYLRAKINDSHVKDYAVPLEDYEEQSQELHDIKLPYIDFKEVAQVLPTCLYQPSYLVKHKLIRFEGARNKSNTHFASVYPPDETNNSLSLLENENIWWWENAVGNSMINEETALSVVSLFMGALEARFRHSYKLRKIISVQQVADPKKGDRFFVELMLTSNSRTGGALVLAEYVYKFPEENRLCFPEGFYWSKQVTVNVIVPVKNSGRWAFYFIRNIAEILRQTRDLNIHVILIDYESSDINIEEALRRSTIQSYTIVKFPAETSFQRALALHRGAQAVTDPHSILFLCDLHLKIPPDLISTIRKHCVEGKMAFAPVVKRLRCGYHPGVPLGYWETLGFGLLAIFKSDFDRAGGMNVQEFRGWGGEDWELLDRVLMSGLEVERLKIPDFYHFYHPNFGKSNQRNGA